MREAEKGEIRKVQTLKELNWRSYQRQMRKTFNTFVEVARANGLSGRWLTYIAEERKRRLLILAAYAEKLGISVEEAIAFLLAYWSKRRPPVHRGGLPCSLAMLSGQVSREALREHVQREYPNNEHLQICRDMKREAMLHAKERLTDKLQNAVLKPGYLDGASTRAEREAAETKLRKSLRNFRGNPWR